MANKNEPTEFKMNETPPETTDSVDEVQVGTESEPAEMEQTDASNSISKYAPEVQKSDDVETHVTASQLTDDTLQNIIDDAASTDPNADEEGQKEKTIYFAEPDRRFVL